MAIGDGTRREGGKEGGREMGGEILRFQESGNLNERTGCHHGDRRADSLTVYGFQIRFE